MSKNLGIATAYGYAKSKGYQGTEEEFAEQMASCVSAAAQIDANTAAIHDLQSAAPKCVTVTNVSVDGIVEDGFYLLGLGVTDKPENYPAFIRTLVSSPNKQFIQQFFISILDDNKIWWRHGRNLSGVYENFAPGLSVTWYGWTRLLDNNDDSLKNRGQTIVCLGDSIMGFERGATSTPNLIAKESGASVHNCCFGGTCASGRDKNTVEWGWFDFASLAELIAGNTVSVLNDHIPSSAPAYFSGIVSLLESIDFSTVDIIILNYGVNDYQNGFFIGDTETPYDTTKYLGALCHGIEQIQTAFPNIRILLATPPYKFFVDSGGQFLYDGDTHSLNSNHETLYDFAQSCEQLRKKYHLPLADLYNMGINRYNRELWFNPGQGSHPNETGRRLTAKRICSVLQGM